MSTLASASPAPFGQLEATLRETGPRVEALLQGLEKRVHARSHRVFTWLLLAQWAFVVIVAAASSGTRSPVVWETACLGGLLTLPALALIRFLPNEAFTRFAIAMVEAGFSALLINLCPGRVDVMFHAFGALAFLPLYRDWRLPVIAAAAVSVHLLIPAFSVASEFTATAPVIAALALEAVALLWLCRTSRREMMESSQRLHQHHQLLDDLEQRVIERTRALENEMRARERTAEELQKNELHHRNLIANVPIGIFETTRAGRINFANPHLLGLIGLPSTFDPTALSFADGQIFASEDRDRMWARLEREQEIRGFAATFTRFDGSRFEVVINAHLKRIDQSLDVICEGTLEDVTSRKRAERDLDTLHSQLVIASRQAGMAEVATGVLHNVGNVLTSVNLIIHDVQDRLKTTRLSHLRKVVEILQREQPRLVEFLTEDGGGKQLPDFLGKLDDHLINENQQLLGDVEGLVRHFEHIREIIVTQQGSAQLFGVLESLAPAQLFEDALRLNAESMERHGIALERVFDQSAHARADRHKVLQILVNLLKNAKDALAAVQPGNRVVRVLVSSSADCVHMAVQDNGPGILPENLTRIFQHGFTTKPTGHGFGLHSSVLAAREMGGDLVAKSAGLGQGSVFILTLPKARAAA